MVSATLAATFSCSGPMINVPKPEPKKIIDTVSSTKSKLKCEKVIFEGGKIILELSDTTNPFYTPGERLLLEVNRFGLATRMPLDFFCNNDNELIWVSKGSIDFLKLNVLAGKFAVSLEYILGLTYSDVIEYLVEDTRVIAGGVLKDPSLSWDKTPIATVTNTGVLQVGTYSMHTFETEEHNRFLYDLRLSQALPEEQRWPKEGVERAVVAMIDDKNVCVIPLGESWQSVKYFYIVHYTGENYKDLADVIVLTMMPQSRVPDLRNILSATVPAYNPAEGKGLHVVLEYEKLSGGSSLIAVLLPDPKEVFKD